MNLPTIEHRIHQPETGGDYVVVAYRPLTRGEIVDQINLFRRQNPKVKRPARGETVVIVTSIGTAD